MELGAFSVSLAVADLAASLDFYTKLGFEHRGGGDNWAIMANGSSVIGLFEGMFEQNILTFNPGWDQAAQETESFTDIRELRDELTDAGIETTSDTTRDSAHGPASFVVVDPDGNPILLDQHR